MTGENDSKQSDEIQATVRREEFRPPQAFSVFNIAAVICAAANDLATRKICSLFTLNIYEEKRLSFKHFSKVMSFL